MNSRQIEGLVNWCTKIASSERSRGSGSTLGRRALQLPVHKGEIVVVHVLPSTLPAKLQRGAAAEAKPALREVVTRARTAVQGRRIRIHSRLLSGPPFVEIIRCSRTLRSELIVLGRHGVRPFRDLFLGTTEAGDARGAVLAEAARRRMDLIALGTHGRSGLAHALMGSVAEAVIAAAPCDVLVARPVRLTFTPP